MRNCNKVITVRLTEDEYKHCETMAKGNKSFYVRQLIRSDISTNETFSKENIIKIVEEYLTSEKKAEQPSTPLKTEHTQTAKQVIAHMFSI